MNPSELADISTRRLALRSAGYALIPVQGKDGLPTGWPDKGGATEEEVASWIRKHPYKTNTGALTRDMPTIDSDITRPDAADAVAEAIRDWFDGRGVILTRFGQPPKRANLFRTDRPFKKLRVDYIDPAAVDPGDPNKGRHHVEILGDGQQIIIDGVHPVTKQPYSWHGGYTPWNTPRADLPELNEGEALTLLEHITEMLAEQFGFQIDPGGSGAKGNGSNEDASFRDSDGRLDVEATLASMPPSGAGANSAQPRCILSLLQKAIHPDDVMAQVVDATMKMADTAKLGWSRDVEVACVLRRCKSEVGKLYKEYDASDGTIPSWLAGDFHQKWVEALAIGRRPELIHSVHIGWHVRSYGAKEEKPQPTAEAPSADTLPPKSRTAPRVLVLRPFVPFDPATLPPRSWLYAKHYQRRTVSLTAGPGGMGKSSLVLVECVAMATARNLLGEQPSERLRVWLHNGEDPLEEILRRLAAICQHYGIPQEELQGQLWITSGNEFPLRVAKGYSNLEINEGLVRQISNAIGENHIDVAAFDPLVNAAFRVRRGSRQDGRGSPPVRRDCGRSRRRRRAQPSRTQACRRQRRRP
jgi:AAA domain/Bifunctional DNA primase/polymerase, N-terminal